jgi:arabinoxylan arabinofuranohydrolase
MKMRKKFLSGFMHIKTSTTIAVVMLVGGMALPPPTFADNPIVSYVYTDDPAARVFNGRVYVVMTHLQRWHTAPGHVMVDELSGALS